jgi:hypothetical protein
MSEHLFSGFAELTPSYKAENPVKEEKDQKDTRAKETDDQVRPMTKVRGKEQVRRPKYVADMSEPRTFLSNVIPQLLRLQVPGLLREVINTKLSGKPELVKMSDIDLLNYFQFSKKARPGSRYQLILSKEDGLCLSFEDEKKGKSRVSGPMFRWLMYVICESVLESLATQLRDDTVWQSRTFVSLSRKITYNPYHKIAAILPALCGKSVPAVVALLLMDQKLSLVTMSYILRSVSVPKVVREKYEKFDIDDEKGAMVGFKSNQFGLASYNILLANGMYDMVTVRWEGVVRKEFDESSNRKLSPISIPRGTNLGW